MPITHFSSALYIELIIGFFVWWFALYLLIQNPFDRVMQLLFLMFASLGYYFASDSFFFVAFELKQFNKLGLLLETSTWTIYIPFIILHHLSFLLIKKKTVWHKSLHYRARSLQNTNFTHTRQNIWM